MSDPFRLKDNNECKLIELLHLIKGATDYSGECSYQVRIPLTDGRVLRVGITDDDVAPDQGLWFDLDYTLNLRGVDDK